MRSAVMKAMWLACLALWLMADVARAQEVEALYPARPEAWLMNYFTSVTLFTGVGVPRSRPLGSIELGLELDWVPTLSEEERLVGFNGTKDIDANRCPVFLRPFITVGLPAQFALSLSYLPPIRFCEVKANLFAFAVERPIYEHLPWRLGLRFYGQVGEVEGDFTCPQAVAQFEPGSPQNQFGCEETSSDTITPRYFGLERSGAYRIDKAAGLTPYLGVAVNYLDTRFQANAQTFGFHDRGRLEAHTWTFSMRAGITYPITERLRLSLGMFYSPLWIVRPPNTSSQNDPLLNIRGVISYQFGKRRA